MVFLLLAVCIVAHTVATGGEDDGSSVLHIHLSIHRCRRRVECVVTGHKQDRETHIACMQIHSGVTQKKNNTREATLLKGREGKKQSCVAIMHGGSSVFVSTSNSIFKRCVMWGRLKAKASAVIRPPIKNAFFATRGGFFSRSRRTAFF